MSNQVVVEKIRDIINNPNCCLPDSSLRLLTELLEELQVEDYELNKKLVKQNVMASISTLTPSPSTP